MHIYHTQTHTTLDQSSDTDLFALSGEMTDFTTSNIFTAMKFSIQHNVNHHHRCLSFNASAVFQCSPVFASSLRTEPSVTFEDK